VLFIDGQTAVLWGRLVAQRQAAGRALGAMDPFIAATATQHGLALVTRNLADFDGLGLELTNPWETG